MISNQTTFCAIRVADAAAGEGVTWRSRLMTAILSVVPATSDLDVGLATIGTVAGIAVGLMALVLAMCWRITTPVRAPQSPSSTPESDQWCTLAGRE